MGKPLSNLQESLNIHFKDESLLKTALVHRSYINEHPSFKLGHNERLEFLGDAVLELVVTKHLYATYPDKDEGVLTNWRAALVNSERLSEVSDDILLNDYLLLSRGEAQDTKGKARRYILADAVEALIGAIYLDQGIPRAGSFIKKYILNKLPYIVSNNLVLDPKSVFQEKSQEILGITPTYRVIKETGPDHSKEFTIGIYIGKTLVAKSIGSSKQEAQVNAAKAGLKKKKWGA